MVLVLRDKDVQSLVSMRDTIQVLEQAFAALADQRALNNPRSRIITGNGVLHVLAAAIPPLGVLGLKTYTTFQDGVRSVVLLFSETNGGLLAMIEADWLGSMRTGGTSALATQYLARQDASSVGLIGAGHQAVTQLMGVCAVRHIRSIKVYSRHEQERVLFCQGMHKIIDVEVTPVDSAREAVQDADIIITATNSKDPVIYGEWLKPGCHINAIGSNWNEKRELDYATLHRSTFVVTDSREQAEMEAGDLLIPLEEELFNWDDVYDLADVISGTAPKRLSDDDITIYKGLGIALEDIAVAAYVYNQAQKLHFGTQLDLLS